MKYILIGIVIAVFVFIFIDANSVHADASPQLTLSKTLSSDLPNKTLTPGAARDVDEQTLCNTSTKLVRNVPESEKKAVYKEYGMQGDDRSICKEGQEIDHVISLELAGSNDITNLWPQSYCGEWNAHIKDDLENHLHQDICHGALSIKDAQDCISSDWVACYKKMMK